MKDKILTLKIKLQVWWANTSSRSQTAVVFGGGIAVLALLGFIIYGAASYFKWNSNKMAIPWVKNHKQDSNTTESVSEVPETEPSPINGVLHTEETAEVFASRRPLAIMINNHTAARPQSGLSKADLVYEAVAEGGITRFLAIFHAQDAEKVGPVRSARIYYEDWAAEFHAWYAHWGGAYMDTADKANQSNPNFAFTCNPEADAYAKINRINLPSLDQMWLGNTAYWRDNSRGVATEHTGYTSTVKLWAEAPNKYPGWEGLKEFDQWEFKEDEPAQVLTGQTVSFNFWETAGFEVRWEYDAESNSYKRFQGGVQQIDPDAGDAPIMAKNVILQFTREDSFGDKKNHLKYETIGKGSAKILRDGEVLSATWEKSETYQRTKFYDTLGQPIPFNRGQIWIEIVPERNAETVVIQ